MLSRLELQKRFGKNIKDSRNLLGLSQYDLSDATGLNRSYIARIETGKSNPPLFTIYKLAMALKIKPTELMIFAKE